ncbi:MAG: hypothetical protein ACOYKN_08985 [Pirellula sp.]
MFVLLLVLDSIQYSYPAHWSASYCKPLRSTVGIAAVQTAIEYEYRFTEYRFAEYEFDEIQTRHEHVMQHWLDTVGRNAGTRLALPVCRLLEHPQ